jgi:hypothetical protein
VVEIGAPGGSKNGAQIYIFVPPVASTSFLTQSRSPVNIRFSAHLAVSTALTSVWSEPWVEVELV